MTNDGAVQIWRASDIYFEYSGIECTGFVEIAYDNSRPIKHTKSTIKGVVGFDVTYREPSFQITMNGNSPELTEISDMCENEELGDFTYRAPNLLVKGYDCMLSTINPGRIAEKTPTVIIPGLALKISEKWGRQVA